MPFVSLCIIHYKFCKQPTRCNKFRLFVFYWSFQIRSTCFGRQTRPSSGALFDCIYSFGTMHRWSAAISVHCTKAVYTVKKCSWRWASLSPETRRADLKRSIKRLMKGICCILLVAYIVAVMMHGLTNVKTINFLCILVTVVHVNRKTSYFF